MSSSAGGGDGGGCGRAHADIFVIFQSFVISFFYLFFSGFLFFFSLFFFVCFFFFLAEVEDESMNCIERHQRETRRRRE